MTVLRVLATAAAAAALVPAAAALVPASPALASPAAVSPAAAPPEGAAIKGIVANGSGCKQGEGVSATWTDASQLKVTYRNLSASTGGDAGPLDFRRNCQVTVQLEIPDGYAAALSGASALLSATVADGATATNSAIAYWSGVSAQNAWSRSQRGPFDDTFVSNWTADPASILYSPCDAKRPLNINQSVRVARGTSAPGARSTVAFDTAWGGANAVYQLTWKRCGS